MSILNARTARERMSTNVRTARKVSIYEMKDALDKAIGLAIAGGRSQASVKAPAEADDALISALRSVLAKLGYRVKVEREQGYLDRGLILEPTTTITISW